MDNIHCNYFQCVKIHCKGLGLFPECDLTNTPWYEVAIDLIRPWSEKAEHFNCEFYALTWIGTRTNLVKLVCFDTKSSDIIARKFEQTRLAWYPRPVWFVHDNGGEFTSYAFVQLLHFLGVKDVLTTSKKPWPNATCKHAHQIMKNGNCVDDTSPITTASKTTWYLASIWWWTCHNNSLEESYNLNSTESMYWRPCVFPWHDPKCSPVVEWQTISHCRELSLNEARLKENQWCINYDYFIGQQVLKYGHTIKGKLAIKAPCPFEIMCIHVNGTITIKLRDGMTEQINICCTIPYTDPWYNWKISYIGGECSANEKHHTSSPFSIPGNIEIPDSPKCLSW